MNRKRSIAKRGAPCFSQKNGGRLLYDVPPSFKLITSFSCKVCFGITVLYLTLLQSICRALIVTTAASKNNFTAFLTSISFI